MNATTATAEVFVTALKALSRKERESVLALIADDKDLREDLLDMALIAARRHEPAKPFRQFIAESKR